MRALFLLALLVPLAAATPPSPPYEFSTSLDAPPVVGRTVTLELRLDARSPLDAPVRLEVPEWVEVEGEREWRARAPRGGHAEHAWRVTPTREGFWRASLSVDASRAEAYGDPVDPARDWQAMGGCCLYAFSGADDGRHAARAEDALPEGQPGAMRLSWRALDAERAQLTMSVKPTAPWVRHGEILAQVPPGAADVQRAPGDAAREFTHVFPLPPGNATVVTPLAQVWVRFDDGLPDVEDTGRARDVDCANVRVEREGDEVREAERWTCYASATRARTVPDAGAAAIAIGSLLACSLTVILRKP